MTSTFRLKCELNPYGKDVQTHQNQKNSLISNFFYSEVYKAWILTIHNLNYEDFWKYYQNN